MASSSGASSGSSLLQNSGSEEDLQQLMDQRKRKRMISNRESARRSRMRKQKHLDDLRGELGLLRKENNQIITSMSVTTQHYMSIESDNSVLRAQVAELSHRLEALNEIISLSEAISGGFGVVEEPYGVVAEPGADFGFMNNPWSYQYVNQQPITASAEMLQY
ncbi:bZIP transcription factor 44-like [Cornus florida]|uniref:bZIP transcription factor 44-like n=1 Tax=Cornus florida TaxID=4283 RepID=UPI00289E5DDD|nr:bZIP transcription factor 44-like [Cornus florida]